MEKILSKSDFNLNLNFNGKVLFERLKKSKWKKNEKFQINRSISAHNSNILSIFIQANTKHKLNE